MLTKVIFLRVFLNGGNHKHDSNFDPRETFPFLFFSFLFLFLFSFLFNSFKIKLNWIDFILFCFVYFLLLDFLFSSFSKYLNLQTQSMPRSKAPNAHSSRPFDSETPSWVGIRWSNFSEHPRPLDRTLLRHSHSARPTKRHPASPDSSGPSNCDCAWSWPGCRWCSRGCQKWSFPRRNLQRIDANKSLRLDKKMKEHTTQFVDSSSWYYFESIFNCTFSFCINSNSADWSERGSVDTSLQSILEPRRRDLLICSDKFWKKNWSVFRQFLTDTVKVLGLGHDQVSIRPDIATNPTRLIRPVHGYCPSNHTETSEQR